jgi:very-short-patch-repair endonuclease
MTDGSATNSPLPLAGGVGGGPEKSGQFRPRNTARAKELRNQATPAERSLWKAMSRRQIAGYKFSRQMPIGPYFADFLCREAMLVIELDGYSHNLQQDYDTRRDTYMADQGYKVIRFTNADVLGNVDGVVQTIAVALEETDPPPTPPASGRGEESNHVTN